MPAKGAGKSSVRSFFKTANPYSDPIWPTLDHEDGATIVELLCSLLEPVGEYRRTYVTRSKGKRVKRQKKKRKQTQDGDKPMPDAPAPSEDKPADVQPDQAELEKPPPPEIVPFITTGFNSTVRSFQNAIDVRKNGNDQGPRPNHPVAVFVERSAQPELLTSQLPFLLHAVNRGQGPEEKPCLLVPLPRGSEARLCEALGIPRVGFVGVSGKAPGAVPLLVFIAERVKPVEIPWMEDVEKGIYRPVKIDSEVREAKTAGKKRKKAET